MQDKYLFAGHVVSVRSRYPLVHQMCAAYRTELPAAFNIAISEEDIQYEKEESARTDLAEGQAIRIFSDDYLETLAVLRKLAEALIPADILLMHGAVVAVDGEAYLFTAPSGVGKSTHVNLWLQQFGKRAVIVNGDKPLLHVASEVVTVYGSPWDGKERMSKNMSCPLKAVCILTRAEENHIEPVTKKEALVTLFTQCYRPADRALLAKTMSLMDRLGDTVSLYRLCCNKEAEAALIAYKGMSR